MKITKNDFFALYATDTNVFIKHTNVFIVFLTKQWPRKKDEHYVQEQSEQTFLTDKNNGVLYKNIQIWRAGLWDGQ